MNGLRSAADLVKALVLILALGPFAAFADPEADLRAAVRELGRSSYAWETTARQRSTGEAAALSLNPTAPVEVTGRTDPDGNAEVTLLPSRQTVEVPIVAVFRSGDAVGHTPLGWLRRTEIRDSEVTGRDRMVEFEGKSLRLSRCLAVAVRAMAIRTPLEEALDLLGDVKGYREADGYLIGDLRDAAIERLWGDPKARSAPEIQGNVIFRLTGGGVTEFHLLLAIGYPASRNRKATWSVQQWTTRIRDVGATTVNPPAEAVRKLAE